MRHGVTFLRETAVMGLEGERVITSRGPLEAEATIVCPGDDLVSLYPDRFEAAGVVRCKLQMMRLADPGFRLAAPVMSDLGLVRYAGYADLPQAAALRRRLEAEQPDHLRHGVHLIAVQDVDGALVVGDSHHDAATPDPFSSDAVDRLILDEFSAPRAWPPRRWSNAGPAHMRAPPGVTSWSSAWPTTSGWWWSPAAMAPPPASPWAKRWSPISMEGPSPNDPCRSLAPSTW